MIGIIGGVGPLAGLDIIKKILEETNSNRLEDQLPILMSSQPHRIGNCQAFLSGEINHNPAENIAEIIQELNRAGATLFVIPAAITHSPKIFDQLIFTLPKDKNIHILHLAEECATYILDNFKDQTVGLLASKATRNLGIYRPVITNKGIEVIEPNESTQEQLDLALNDENFGLKLHSSPITNRAHDIIIHAIQELKNLGSKAILVTETEFIKAIRENELFGATILDPNRIIARALIQKTAPHKLKQDT